jgi:hypothetical protein
MALHANNERSRPLKIMPFIENMFSPVLSLDRVVIARIKQTMALNLLFFPVQQRTTFFTMCRIVLPHI